MVVNCLLPGQIRRLGTQVTFVTARRPTKTTAEDCAIRGGEYVAEDPSNYATALEIWLETAKKGDPEAQYYVGALYEKGVTGEHDYNQARAWYTKSAEQGYSQAAMNLGRLYEQGLGSDKSSEKALTWYARASGMNESDLNRLMQKKASTRIYELESSVAERDQKIGHLQKEIDHITGEVNNLKAQLRKRTGEAVHQRESLQQTEKEYQRLRGKLDRAIQDPSGPETVVQYEAQLRDVQIKMVRLERELEKRNTEIATLQEQIAVLESEVEKQEMALGEVPGTDLGMKGPTIEIIDPPIILARGIRVEPLPRIMTKSGASPSLSGRIFAPAGLRSLAINGQRVAVNEEGLFTVELPILHPDEEEYPVEILAVDFQNKRSIARLLVTPRGTITQETELPKKLITEFGQYHALIIGNDRYKHWEPLNNAVSDARAVAEVLKDRYGFRVTVLENATRKDVLKTLNDLRKKLTNTDNLLIYYAGHGHLEAEIDRGYWIPVDAEVDDNSQWILLPTITDLLQLIKAKHVLVVADSCFAGQLTRSGLAKIRPDLSPEEREDVLIALAKKKVRTALTSGGVNPVLDTGGGKHSIFTKAFLGVLRENTIILETERLFWAVRTRVLKASQDLGVDQVPTYWPIQFAGHESLGDFIFLPQGA